mmetsp:Transcript_8794/g.12798  ORF Transcript_8794/g.12798 Transcript_8794/m.12798 type:complete len:80 (+) Transcript_8794:1548-1787(+)
MIELTGFEMMAMMALGQWVAQPSTSALTIEALMLKRSSRVIPGLRGTPAGITTRSDPLRHVAKPSSSGEAPNTLAFVGM